MASFNEFGIEELIGSFEKLANIPNEVIDEMCSAAADIAVPAFKAAVPVKTGQMRDSIKKLKRKNNKTGEPFYVVRPQGTRKPEGKATKGVRNAEVGFVLEYGAPHKHLPALQWMSKTNEQIADQCVKAQFAIYSDYIDKTGGST